MITESCWGGGGGGGSNMTNIFLIINIVRSAIEDFLKFLLCAEHNQVVLALSFT